MSHLHYNAEHCGSRHDDNVWLKKFLFPMNACQSCIENADVVRMSSHDLGASMSGWQCCNEVNEVTQYSLIVLCAIVHTVTRKPKQVSSAYYTPPWIVLMTSWWTASMFHYKANPMIDAEQ